MPMSRWTDAAGPALAAVDLDALARAVRRGTLELASPGLELGRLVAVELAGRARTLLADLSRRGMPAEHAAGCLEVLATQARETEARRPELVWSNFDTSGMLDTEAASAALFASAEHSVIVSTYSVGLRRGGLPLLFPLRDRLLDRPKLQIQILLGAPGQERTDVLRSIARLDRAAWTHFWPWRPRPALYVGPARPDQAGVCVHAKCIVVDDERALVTSANLTRGGHETNVEAGVLLNDRELAHSLRVQLQRLISRGLVRPIRG